MEKISRRLRDLAVDLIELAAKEGAPRPSVTQILAWMIAGQAARRHSAVPDPSQILNLDRPEVWSRMVADRLIPAVAQTAVWESGRTDWKVIKHTVLCLADFFGRAADTRHDDPVDLIWELTKDERDIAAPVMRPEAAELIVQTLGDISGQRVLVLGGAPQLVVLVLRCQAIPVLSGASRQTRDAGVLLAALAGFAGEDAELHEADEIDADRWTGAAVIGTLLDRPYGPRANPDWRTTSPGLTVDRPSDLLIGRLAHESTVSILVPLLLLFGSGPNRSFRERLIQSGRLLSAATLPSKWLAGSGAGVGLLVLRTRDAVDDWVAVMALTDRFGREHVELAAAALTRRSCIPSQLRDVVESARIVHSSDIERQEFSLLASRYATGELLDRLGPTVALKDIAEVVRAPVPSTVGARTITGHEIGIPDLDRWLAIEDGDCTHEVAVTASKTQTFLRRGDVVLSNKGTVGRAGIVGEVTLPTVVSSNCVALRLRSGDWADSVFLLMFMRSPTGRRLLEALRSGATVLQINPKALLESFRLPQPTVDVKVTALASYERLCGHEAEINRLRTAMRKEIDAQWPDTQPATQEPVE